MIPCIHHIETVVPPYACPQEFSRDQMARWLPGKRTPRLIRAIYNRSGIKTRYSVLPELSPGEDPVLFREDADGHVTEPTTESRNRQYAEWSRVLAVDVARNAINNADGFTAEDVTHLIMVTCTGFCNPGPDLEIVQGLGLAPTVERYQLGFMGCYAAFPALRMAKQFCQAQPDAVVLVVCLELCSLHLQLREEPDSLLANALFADGAAAAVVSARPPAPHRPALALHAFSSAIAPEGVGDMSWSIGDRGFDIRLTSNVPGVIAANISAIAERLLAAGPWGMESIRTWAVHPGGRMIVDKVEKELGLTVEQLEDARAVLRDFGNMSSPTILFVLQRILARSDESDSHPICAMTFGPGLAIETALLDRIAAVSPTLSRRQASAASTPT